MRVGVVWPKPRAHRWRLGREKPDSFPDLSDGLLFLEEQGIDVAIENSCPRWLNPLVGYHEFYSGLDPVRAMRVALHASRYDVLVCIGDATAWVLLWIKRVFGLRVPILLIDPALGDGYPRRKKLQDFVLPRVDRVVVYGRAQLDYLEREYGRQVDAVFLHHRADTDFYAPSDRDSVDRTVVSVGHDVSRDFDTLARAAEMVRSGPTATRFVVHTSRPVADPAGALDIRRDFISYPALRDLYWSASVVVVPLADTRHAGGINAVVEAMACGVPLVVSGSQGIVDYVEDGRTGLVVPPGDARALATAIERLLSDRDMAARLAAAARHFIVDRCANRAYAANLAAIVREVAAV